MEAVDGAAVRRPRGRPGYDRETVLRRAIDLFNTRGYDATSMSDLAAELGVGKSALYHHFEGKEALLSAALDEALDAISSALEQATRATSGESAHDRLHAALESAVLILAAHLPAVTLLLRVRGNTDVELAALARRRHIDDQLATLVKEAQAEGSIRTDLDPDVTSRLAFGLVNSLIDWFHPDGPMPPDELARAVALILFEGLARP